MDGRFPELWPAECGGFDHERPADRLRRPRACAGLGDLGQPAADASSTARPAMPASPRSPNASPSIPPTTPRSSRFCRDQRHRLRRHRPRGAAGRGPGRRSARGRHQGVRAVQGRGAARRLKGFTKDLCRESASRPPPTAASRCAPPPRPISPAQPLPIVVKADGLAAGKGVIIADDAAEAERGGRRMLRRRASARPAPRS